MAQGDQVILIHGWSASSSSMKTIGGILAEAGYQTRDIYLGDYPSTDDDVRLEDVARRLDAVVRERQATGDIDARFHVVVHSTGALVTRRWLADRQRAGATSPVDNLLMLAPANFGSPLATMGRSLVGRMKAGLFNGMQSGTEILHGLELGSQFQQDLALEDRLSRDGEDLSSPYSEDGTRIFVMVGALQVDGTQILDQSGWDGTVRIASAHMDPQGLTVDFSHVKPGSGDPAEVRTWKRRGPERTAFAVLPDHDHLTILRPEKSEAKNPGIRNQLPRMILEALGVESAAQYRAVIERWDGVRRATRQLAGQSIEAAQARAEVFGSTKARRIPRKRFNEHYQVVVEAFDAGGFPIDDYGVWLSSPRSRSAMKRREMSREEIDAHSSVLQAVHVNTRNAHRRVLHLDRYELLGPEGYFARHESDEPLMAAISAEAVGRNISYGLGRGQMYGYLPLRPVITSASPYADDPGRFLRRYATHFVEVRLPREPAERVFSLKRMG
ncbi:MAG: alpha/beta hydrolase [Alphaproteobacteria bacterium]|nr:alpha/beta hydrolase [Alphaproteobacteria bacterium]